MSTFTAKVRNTYGTYMARFNGISASCTAGEIQAVEALAKKVFGNDSSGNIQFIETDAAGRNCYSVSLGEKA